MINKNRLRAGACFLILITVLCWLPSCRTGGDPHRQVVAPPADRPLLRFDRALFAGRDTVTAADVGSLRATYGLFFDLFCTRVLRIPDSSDRATAFYLTHFIRDPDLQMLYAASDSLYHDVAPVHDVLNSAFGYYRHYFPGKVLPRFITCLSAFNYQVITADSVLAISLDMYLGADRREMYGSVGFPAYMSARFSAPYIPVDAMKGWFQSEYDPDSAGTDLLGQMVYYGKMLYFLDCTLPGVADTIKIGYSGAQYDWCRKNEANLWAHLIGQKLLFSTDQQAYFKFINDGPTTSGLPQESPGRIGQWVGWQIVRAWAHNNPDVPVRTLMRETGDREVLNGSGYKPAR